MEKAHRVRLMIDNRWMVEKRSLPPVTHPETISIIEAQPVSDITS